MEKSHPKKQNFQINTDSTSTDSSSCLIRNDGKGKAEKLNQEPRAKSKDQRLFSANLAFTAFFIPHPSFLRLHTSYESNFQIFTATLELFFSELTSRQFDFFTQLVQIKAQVDHKHIYFIDIIGSCIKIRC